MIGLGSYLKDYLEYYNITQVEFAERLDISKEYLNKILNKNIDISNELMIAISLITDIDIKFIIDIEGRKKKIEYLKDKFGNNLEEYLKQFNINELEKRNWLIFKHKEDNYQNAIDILNFLRIRNFDAMDNITNNIMYKKKDDSDKTKLLLWISRCNLLANKQNLSIFDISNIDKLLNILRIERNNKFNYDSLIKIFNDNGFYFVIEDALKGTKVRGCSKVRNNKPAIYLTKTYKDKASLYFAMYHEIGHIKQNYSKAKNKYIIDEDEDLEKNADLFAINEMIDINIYNEIIKDNNYINNSILISKKYNIPMCFIVRILAYNNIIKYNSKFYLDNIERIL